MRKTIFDFDLCPVIPSPHESSLTAQNCFPVQIKTFSAHVKSKIEHDVSEKRFNAHAVLQNSLHASIKNYTIPASELTVTPRRNVERLLYL